MRTRFSQVVLVILGIGLMAFTSYSYLPEYLGRKMEKQVFKVFGKEVNFEAIPLHDSVQFNHQLYAVHQQDSITGYAMISRALGCKLGGCDKPTEDSLAFEQFYYMTAFNSDHSIRRVRILEYTSNHGYQIANKGWLRQFEKGDRFEVGKNIDGISGATISVKSITKGVNCQKRIISTLTQK